MKKTLSILLVIVVIGVIAYYGLNNQTQDEKPASGIPVTPVEPIDDTSVSDSAMEKSDVSIIPISHATAVFSWGESVFYIDPVGGAEAFTGQPEPDFILITDVHGDHLDIDTLENVVGGNTVILAPQAVADLLPAEPGASEIPLASRLVVLANGESALQLEFTIHAIPMYNLPESDDSRHVKGRGNGYVVERDDTRVYIAGDTADIPEMRSLQDIDIALIPMNLPYTMDVATAADAVLEFKPKQVYPYHYRSPDGLSDVAKFKELVDAGDAGVEVVQLNWYPE